MEKSKDYLTKDGWRRGWTTTRNGAKSLLEKIIQKLRPTFTGKVVNVQLADGFTDIDGLLGSRGDYYKYQIVYGSAGKPIDGLYKVTLENPEGVRESFFRFGKLPEVGSQQTYRIPRHYTHTLIAKMNGGSI